MAPSDLPGPPSDDAALHAQALPIRAAGPSELRDIFADSVPAASGAGSRSRAYRSAPPTRNNRRQTETILVVAGVCAALVAAAGLLFVYGRSSSDTSFTIDAIPDQEVGALGTLQISIPRHGRLASGERLRFALETPIEGLNLDSESGDLSWTPTAKQGPRVYPVVVAALIADKKVARREFKITVRETSRAQLFEPIPEQVTDGKRAVSLTITARERAKAGGELRFQLLGGAPPDAKLDPQTGKFDWQPTSDAAAIYRVSIGAFEAGRSGVIAKSAFVIRVKSPNAAAPMLDMGKGDLTTGDLAKNQPASSAPAPMDEAPRTKPSSVTPVESMLNATTKPSLQPAEDEEILALYRDKKLFARKEYPALRKLFAARFEREHEAEIKAALGADYNDMQAWFADHEDVKEDLYTAIDPRHDKLPAVFSLFNQLRKEFPDKLADYAQLAIATALVWDDEGVIDNLEGSARRTKAVVPSDRLDALGNFKFLVDAEPVMQGRVLFAPWEFLTHMVNNKTPRAEREWAMQNFVQRRAQIGTCYSDVPYDYLMLKTHDEKAMLNDQQYTLPNLLQFGGVCSQQADFAARVSKSIGAPAEVVGGTSSDGEGHAWVMWVELSHMTKDHVGFALQSHGRYRSHHYYVGTLTDPHTGQGITDRQLELRLYSAGNDVQAKRHADLAMRAYEIVFSQIEASLKERIEYLAAVMNLCPGNEDAWRSVARLAKENAGEKEISKSIIAAIGRMFATFVAHPDFTWEIFDDLVSYDQNIRTRMNLLTRLLKMYEAADRPDLASKACLKLTDYLVEDKRKVEAIEILIQSISAFPKESTIVLPMLDRLETLCDDTEGGGPYLVRFYDAFVPLVPQTVDGRVSRYCVQLLERAAARFKTAGRTDLAQAAEAQLARLKAMDRPPGN